MRSLIPWIRGGRRSTPAGMGTETWLDSPDWGWSRLEQMPTLDVSEDEKRVTVRMEVPGLSKDDLRVTWENGSLKVSGEKREVRGQKRRYRECSYGYFSRSVPLGKDLDWKSAKATCRDGVLTISLDKTPAGREAVSVKVD